MKFACSFSVIIGAILFLAACGETKSPSKKANDLPGNSYFYVKELTSKNDDVVFEFHITKDGDDLDHKAFLGAMSQDADFAKNVMRGFALSIDHFKLDKCGFGATADPQKKPFYILIKGAPADSCSTLIRPNMPYDVNHSYKNIIEGNEHAANRTDSGEAIERRSIVPVINLPNVISSKVDAFMTTVGSFSLKSSP